MNAHRSIVVHALSRAALVLVALTLLASLSACRRRRVAPRTATAAAAPELHASPEAALARHARRALDCHTFESWPIAPRLVLAEGCGHTVDLFMVDELGSLWLTVPSVQAEAARAFSCSSSELDVVFLPGVARRVTGCGQTQEFELHCRGGGCAWQPRGVAGLVPTGYASAPPSAPPPVIVAAPAGVAPRRGPAVEVRARVAAQREALARCAWGSFTIHARWSATGSIAFSLSEPLAGTPAELCARAALAMEGVQADAAGEVDVVVP